MARLLTQAQYARKTKYSRARITQLVKQGVIILKKGKVDPVQAGAAITANIDRSRQLRSEKKSKSHPNPQMSLLQNGFNTESKNGVRSTSATQFNTEDGNNNLPSLTEARRNRELIRIQKELIELKEKRGELVPKNEAKTMVMALGTATKLALLNLPRRLAPRLKVLTDEKEIEIYLRSEIKNIILTLGKSHGGLKRHQGREEL